MIFITALKRIQKDSVPLIAFLDSQGKSNLTVKGVFKCAKNVQCYLVSFCNH